MSIPSIFQIIGPVMVGPSSSHTAGAVRIGLEAGSILAEEPVSIGITLFGSYAKGYRGHKTDVAVLAGCLGIGTGDPKVRTAPEEAQARGIKVRLEIGDNPDYHTNTAVVELTGKSGRRISVRGISIGGGIIKIEEAFERRPDGTTIKIDINREPSKNALNDAVQIAGLESCRELVEEAEAGRIRLSELILKQESLALGETETEIKKRVLFILQVMKKAVQNGLSGQVKSIGGLTENDALKVTEALHKGLLLGDSLYANAVSWAMAVNESNTGMGVVAAAPTGGACGVLPGAVLAAAHYLNSSDEDTVLGLVTAGGIGARVAAQTSLSASVAGCQVEVGVAVGMAAGAVVEMKGGSPSQCADAAALGIKSFIGLTCGALGGLCEVPCVKRNGIGAAAALAAANMALAGVRSQLPLDEVILGLADTGRRIPKELLGTTLTGLAGTPTGREVYRQVYPDRDLTEDEV